jgi:hypothetical protein
MALIEVPRWVCSKHPQPEGQPADASLRQHEAQHMRADPTALILWNDIELIQLQVRPELVYAQQTHRNRDQLNDLRPARLCIQCCASATVSL